ncbi:unnamed protein product [Spirodela intermedia]|uniref:Uncharacterized protein n=1 Tax=Spirodela intermedia TaxID=51605 RepID=A0A7I8IBC2_SPIIN|nr:unnamed protein product [Spirodela intermedia]CAA6654181.1 unnamed protein product [Spirodela intermedia]
MGKQSRLKASAKEKKKQSPTMLVAERPDMEEVQIRSAAASTQEVSGGGDALEGKPMSGVAPPAPSAEEIRQLRTLNDILARRMLEARQERNQDQSLLSDLESGAIRAALASQLSEEARRLVLVAEERGRAGGAEAARREADRERDLYIAETESSWSQAMAEADKKNTTKCEEISLLKVDLQRLAREKADVEETLRAAEEEVGAIAGNLGDARKALELAHGENVILEKKLHSLLRERDEIQKEKRSLESRVIDAEICRREDEEALERARSEYRALEKGNKVKDEALESLAQEKAFLEKKLAASQVLADDLKRRMAEAAQASADELEKVVRQGDEARQGLDLQTREMQVLVTRSWEVAREMRDVALCKCQPPEEVSNKWRRDLDSSMAGDVSLSDSLLAANKFMAHLNTEMSEIFKARSEELEQSQAEMKKTIAMMETELQDLAKVNFRLNSELSSVRDGYQSLKVEDADLKVEILRLKDELSGQLKEKEMITSMYQAQIEDARREKDELSGKVDEAGRERNMMKKKKAELEDEIAGLRESMAELKSEVADLRALSEDYAREKDDSLKLLREKTQQVEELMLELGELEKGKLAIEKELEGLLEERESQAIQVRSLGEERSSLQRSLADAEGKVKSAAEEAPPASETREGDQSTAVDEEVRPFALEIEALHWGLKSRRVEIEGMNQELKRHQESAAVAQQANSRWKFFSSAMAAAAALLSIAFAAKAR